MVMDYLSIPGKQIALCCKSKTYHLAISVGVKGVFSLDHIMILYKISFPQDYMSHHVCSTQSLEPVDSHTGSNLPHGQDPGAPPNLTINHVPLNITSILVELSRAPSEGSACLNYMLNVP